jgi:hypothetical protein
MIEHSNIKIFSLLTVVQVQIFVSFMSIKDGKNITESNSVLEDACHHNLNRKAAKQYFYVTYKFMRLYNGALTFIKKHSAYWA